MIKIDHISFSYGEENENTGGVRDIDLNIEDGQFVVLCGESGCGKTTVTRLINGLIPHYYEGKMTGEVWVNGAKVSEQPLYDTAAVVGSVFQNPRSQFFNVDTTSEITFGCENLGQPEKDIRERLAKTVRDFRLEKLMTVISSTYLAGRNKRLPVPGYPLWNRMFSLWTNPHLTWMRLPSLI